MVRLGKVYGNRMVDVAVTNAKLEDRALRILEDLAALPRSEGRSLLEQSGGSVKLALLMARRELGVEEARQHLDHCGGQLRRALTEQL
jgi:N-acetylmuramic acid 6-phosphate etherase